MELYNNDGNLVDNATEGQETPEITMAETEPNEFKPSLEYILTQMGKIQNDKDHINLALESLVKLTPHPPSMNAADYATQAQAEAMGEIVKSREATNQKLLEMYQTMYDDIRPSNSCLMNDKDKINELQAIIDKMKNNVGFGDAFAHCFQDVFAKAFN